MANLDAIEIEKRAIVHLKEIIIPYKRMNDFINDNDKEPSWDGMIYLYNQDGYKAEDLRYRVPIQVKGKNDPSKLKSESFTFPIEYKHLRNYANDGGVFYLVVIVCDEFEKFQVFYNGLTPIKLQSILKGTEGKKPNDKKLVRMKKLRNNDEKELYRLLDQFETDRINQGRAKGEILKRTIDVSRIKEIDSIRLNTYSYSPDEVINRITTGEICLYGHDVMTDTWYPFSYDEQIKIKIVKCIDLDKPFGVDGKVFYNKAILKEDNGEKIIQLSENLTINDTKKKFYFNPISTIDILENDILFLKAIKGGEKITIGTDYEIPFDTIKYPKKFINNLDELERIISSFKKYNVRCTKRMDEFNEKDWRWVNTLVKLYLGKIPKDYKSEWLMWWWEDKVYPIFISCELAGGREAYNLLTSTNLKLSIEDNGKHYIIPNCCMYKRDIWEKIYNFDESIVLEQLEECDYNLITEQLLSSLFVELLAGYDVSKNNSCFNIAQYISEKLCEIDPTHQYYILNRLQLLKRKRDFFDSEISELEKIQENPMNDMVSCAVDILLENRHSAKKKIQKLSEQDRKNFKQFPIYNLL